MRHRSGLGARGWPTVACGEAASEIVQWFSDLGSSATDPKCTPSSSTNHACKASIATATPAHSTEDVLASLALISGLSNRSTCQTRADARAKDLFGCSAAQICCMARVLQDPIVYFEHNLDADARIRSGQLLRNLQLLRQVSQCQGHCKVGCSLDTLPGHFNDA